MFAAIAAIAATVTSTVGASFTIDEGLQLSLGFSALNSIAATNAPLYATGGAAIYSVLDGYAERMLTYDHDSTTGTTLKNANGNFAPYGYAAERDILEYGLGLHVLPSKYAQVVGNLKDERRTPAAKTDRAWCLPTALPLPAVAMHDVAETNAFDAATLSGVLSSHADMNDGNTQRYAFGNFGLLADCVNTAVGTDVIAPPSVVTTTNTLRFAYADLAAWLATWEDSDDAASDAISVGQFRKRERGMLPLMGKVMLKYKASPEFENVTYAAANVKRVRKQEASTSPTWSSEGIVLPSLSGYDTLAQTNSVTPTATNADTRAVCSIGNASSSMSAAFGYYFDVTCTGEDQSIWAASTSRNCNGIILYNLYFTGGCLCPNSQMCYPVHYTVDDAGNLDYEIVGYMSGTPAYSITCDGYFFAEGTAARSTTHQRTQRFVGITETARALPPWYGRRSQMMHIDCAILTSPTATNHLVGCGSVNASAGGISAAASGIVSNMVASSAARFLSRKGGDVAGWIPIDDSKPIAAKAACVESYAGTVLAPYAVLTYESIIVDYNPATEQASTTGYGYTTTGWTPIDLEGLHVGRISAYVTNWDSEHAPSVTWNDAVGYRSEEFPATWWLLLSPSWGNFVYEE